MKFLTILSSVFALFTAVAIAAPLDPGVGPKTPEDDALLKMLLANKIVPDNYDGTYSAGK